MAYELRCIECHAYLGEIVNGKVKRRSVQLCETCWELAKAAMNLAESKNRGIPGFMKDLFGGLKHA